jgi:hypothetical protein
LDIYADKDDKRSWFVLEITTHMHAEAARSFVARRLFSATMDSYKIKINGQMTAG